MKALLHLFALSLFISFILSRPTGSAHASSPHDSVPNPAAEDYLLSELRASGIADLQKFPEGERVISGEVLLKALKDPQVQSNPFVLLSHAVVVDELWANDLHIPINVTFYQMEFERSVYFTNAQLAAFIAQKSTFKGDVDFSSAGIGGYIDITDNTFQGNLIFTRTDFSGNVDLRDNLVEKSLNFYGTHVSGELLLDGIKVSGTQPMEDSWAPAEFWSTTVEGPASMYQAYFAGNALFDESNFSRLNLEEATFKGDVSFGRTSVESFADFDDAQFFGKADFTNFYAGNTASFVRATFQAEVTFESATAIREADFTNALFNGPAKFDYFTDERFTDFINTTFNQSFSFYYATVAWPYFENATFNGPVNFEGMQASQDFELPGARYNYTAQPFWAPHITVAGVVSFDNFIAPAGIVLSNGHFGNLSFSTKDLSEIESIDLTGTDIDGQLVLKNVCVQNLLAEGVSVGKSTTLNQVSIAKKLDMRNASIGFFKMDTQPAWPNDPNSFFNLRGMTYTDIDLGNQGLTEETWQGVLLILNEASYSPQAYQAFSRFLADKGHPDWAAQVDLKQKRRERDEALPPLSGAWLWSWFLDIFVGYGHHPALAFIWSGLVIAIGALVFRRREDMLPIDQSDAKVEYNPIWYSFALFIPYIDLGIAEKWEPNPERKWARNYKYVHMLLGWVLAPIALLTFGGIIG